MQIQRATVFGGSGFIGQHIVQRLAARGVVVRVAVRDPEAALFLKPMGAVGQIVPCYADIRDARTVNAAVQGVEAVFNAVSLYTQSGRARFGDIHVAGAETVARAAAEAGARLVHMSGLGSTADAEARYARARGEGDERVMAVHPEATLLKPSAVFGPGDHFFTMIAGLMAMTPVFPVIGAATRLQPVYVGNVADAALAALDDPATKGAAYELGGPRVYPYRRLVEMVKQETGRATLLVNWPFWFASFAATIAGLVPGSPLTRDMVALMRHDNVVSGTAPTLADLGVAPVAVEAVLPLYMDAFRRGGRWKRSRPG